MQVLVWKSYGDISVHDVSTPEKFKNQIFDMIDCVGGWGIEKEIELVESHIEKHPEDMKELRRAFNTLVNAIGEGADNFEDIFITELK